MSEILRARGLHRDYTTARGVLSVLRGVDLTLAEGEFVSILGASGTGKSTLLHLLGGLDHPTQGSVVLDGVDLTGLTEPSISHVRNRRVGFVFQFHHLLPEFTALENVMLPARISRVTERAARAKATTMLEDVGLAERALHRPGELSGGERQRVALARAMINQPKVLLLDEPTGNLDQATGESVVRVVLELRRAHGAAVVMVTHNFELARHSDRVLDLKDGLVLQRTERDSPPPSPGVTQA